MSALADDRPRDEDMNDRTRAAPIRMWSANLWPDASRSASRQSGACGRGMWSPGTSSAPGRRRHRPSIAPGPNRSSFEWLAIGRAVPRNPAASMRGPSHTARQCKTTVLDAMEGSPSALLWLKFSNSHHRQYHQPAAFNLNKILSLVGLSDS